MSIPKIIHYCWYGKKPIPKILQFCIKTWQEQLPEYKFVLWNEDNTEFDCDFAIKAYNEKKWAFVSDYVRLKAIYEYGGIYLDTDMLILKPIDFFLSNECFFVAEHNTSIGVGIFGATPNNNFIKSCLNYYRNSDVHEVKFIGIPKIVYDIFFEKYGDFILLNKNLEFDGLTIYEPNYFYSLPYSKLSDIHLYEKYLTENSYGVHLWYGSWHNYNETILIRRKEYYKAFKKMYNTFFIDKNVNLKYLKKILLAFKDSMMTKNAFK